MNKTTLRFYAFIFNKLKEEICYRKFNRLTHV